jgi:hypothetical protein
MAKPTNRFKRLPATREHFVDIVHSLEVLEAAHPEHSRSSEVKAAIAELERRLRNLDVTLPRIVDLRIP